MTRKIRPADSTQAFAVKLALSDLRRARGYLKVANCPAAVKAVTHAIRSAEGAQRHMRHRRRRTEEAES